MDSGLNRRQDAGITQGNLFCKLAKTLMPGNRLKTEIANSVDEDSILIENIREAKNEWTSAVISFDYADDQDLVDYYTYKIKACQVRYEYYIKKAKEKGLKVYSLDKEIQMFDLDAAGR